VTRPVHVFGSVPRPAHVCTCAPTDVLDVRDRVIVARLAEGVPLSQIGVELHHTVSTVSTLIATARGKVGARTREQLVAIAFRDRLIGFGVAGAVVVLDDSGQVAA